MTFKEYYDTKCYPTTKIDYNTLTNISFEIQLGYWLRYCELKGYIVSAFNQGYLVYRIKGKLGTAIEADNLEVKSIMHYYKIVITKTIELINKDIKPF